VRVHHRTHRKLVYESSVDTKTETVRRCDNTLLLRATRKDGPIPALAIVWFDRNVGQSDAMRFQAHRVNT